jgi:hypothetical protein
MEAIYIPSVLDSHCKAYYRCNNLNDSKNSNTLTATGTITYPGGKYGKGIYNGAVGNNYVSVATDLVGTSDEAFAGHFRLNSEIASGVWGFGGMGKTSPNSYVLAAYYEYNGGTRRLHFNRSLPGVGNSDMYYNVDLGTKMHHIALMTLGVGGMMYGYLDGKVVASLYIGGLGFGSGGFADVFGFGADLGGNATPGIYDDWLVWDNCRTDAEIAALALDKYGSMF